MTEAEWLGCTVPSHLWGWCRRNHMTWLDGLKVLWFGMPMPRTRKILLLTCAFIRHYWPTLADCYRRQVEGAERTVDRPVRVGELEDVAFTYVLPGHIFTWEYESLSKRRMYWTPEDAAEQERVVRRLERYYCECFREVYGHFFYSVRANPFWVSWNDGTCRRIAEGIYQEGAFERMPILADALEEAGCTNADILNHCRQPGEHVRGCWVVDVLLGRS